MATELFFGSASAQISRGRNDLNKVGSNIGWRALEFKLASGSSANTTTTVATVAGPTAGLETRASATAYYEWISPPISSSVTVAGSITFNICANQSANAANSTVSVVLESVDTTGSIKSTIIDSSFVTELSNANAKRTWSATPTSTVVNKGERLRARVYFDDGGGNMGSGQTCTFTFNGTLANVGDSNITLTENINFMGIDGSKDTGFDNSTGLSGQAYALAIDSNGKLYVVGAFTTYKGVAANRIIRLNPDGSKDTGFDNSTGFDNFTYALAIDSNGKIYVGGNFTTYKGVSANRIIRLNSDGTRDTGFDMGTGFSFVLSGNDYIETFAIDSNGKLYVGGWWNRYKGAVENRIIRLNPDGTKDTGFDNSTGFDNTVRTIAIDSNGKIYVGGDFTTYKGVSANRIIRLNSDGTKDTGFDNSTGFNTGVLELAIDSNGKIYVGGAFTTYKGVTENRIIRLNPDGSKDTGFDNSTGFNSTVEAFAIDSNGKIYVGGGFTTYKDATENRIIRLNTTTVQQPLYLTNTASTVDQSTIELLASTTRGDG